MKISEQIEIIFKEIEANVNNLDSFVFQSGLNNFDYSKYNVSFYSNGVKILPEDNAFIEEYIEHFNKIVDERLNTLNSEYLKLFLTMRMVSEMDRDNLENHRDRFNILLDLIKSKKSELIKHKRHIEYI